MRPISLLTIAFTLAACGHDSVEPTAVPSTIPGTYTLTTLDGMVLPATVIDLGAYKAKLASGTLTVRSGGTYTFDFGIRIEDSGNVRTQSDTDDGHWSVNGNAITLTSARGTNTKTGTVTGINMTLQSSTNVLALTKNRQ
jgi:hypothetical protein